MNENLLVYVDLDGVLADFDKYYEEQFGLKPTESADEGEFWHRVNLYRAKTHKGWFSLLPKMPDAKVLWNYLSKNTNFIPLTATGLTRDLSVEEKTRWLYAYFGYTGPIFFVQSGKDKARFANPNAVLIDDRAKAIDPWITAGGIGILHKSAEETIKILAGLV